MKIRQPKGYAGSIPAARTTGSSPGQRRDRNGSEHLLEARRHAALPASAPQRSLADLSSAAGSTPSANANRSMLSSERLRSARSIEPT